MSSDFKTVNETVGAVAVDDAELTGDTAYIEAEAKLDSTIDAAISKHFDEPEELKEWEASEKPRREIERRYGDVGTYLDHMHSVRTAMREDPAMAAERLSSFYIHSPQVALFDQQTKTGETSKPAVKDEDVHPYVRLDNILEAAIDGSERRQKDKSEYSQQKSMRAFLRETFPGETYESAFNRLLEADNELRKDPIGAANKIAAKAGMPLTPLAAEFTSVVAEARQHETITIEAIQQAANSGYLPHLGAYHAEILDVISHPNFPKTGDPLTRLRAAHDYVVHTVVQNSARRPSAPAAAPAKQKGRSNLDKILDSALTRMGYGDD